MFILDVESVTTNEPDIMYKSVFEGEEAAMLVWFAILGVGHYCWLQSSHEYSKVASVFTGG